MNTEINQIIESRNEIKADLIRSRAENAQLRTRLREVELEKDAAASATPGPVVVDTHAGNPLPPLPPPPVPCPPTPPPCSGRPTCYDLAFDRALARSNRRSLAHLLCNKPDYTVVVCRQRKLPNFSRGRDSCLVQLNMGCRTCRT